jgi:hypothetical protein
LKFQGVARVEEKKEATKIGKNQEAVVVPLEYLVLDYQKSKYDVIPLAAEWSKMLRRKEEHRHLIPSEILDLAMRDVLSGNITWKDVRKTTSEPEVLDTPLNDDKTKN